MLLGRRRCRRGGCLQRTPRLAGLDGRRSQCEHDRYHERSQPPGHHARSIVFDEELTMKRWISALLVLVAITALPAMAKDGQQEKVVGVVADVDYPHIEVTTGDKKSVLIMLDGSTVVMRDGKKVPDTDINVGDHLTAETTEKGGMMMVRTLTVSTPKK
jgi:hypothetical protein